MRYAIILLIVLGVVAAGAAVLLFQWFQAGSARAATGDGVLIDVLTASDNLPPRTLLTQEHVKTERVPRSGLPRGCFTSQTQAIGKTLKTAVIKGQPLSESCCIAKGSIDDLLRPGMLAFPVPLSQRSTAIGLIYPGCVVDVFATFALRNHDKGEAVVTPLLQNIQVLGVADNTVVSASQDKAKASDWRQPRNTSNGHVTVTLEVTSRQAAALQLAMEQGTLGLAMRNPLDKDLNSMEPMLVKEGQLTAGSESMDPQTLALFGRIQQMLDGDASNVRPGDPNSGPRASAEPPGGIPDSFVAPSQKRSAWQMTIIRGQKVEETEIPLDDDPDANTQETR